MKVVLDCKIIYFLLIIENTAEMSHLKIVGVAIVIKLRL